MFKAQNRGVFKQKAYKNPRFHAFSAAGKVIKNRAYLEILSASGC